MISNIEGETIIIPQDKDLYQLYQIPRMKIILIVVQSNEILKIT